MSWIWIGIGILLTWDLILFMYEIRSELHDQDSDT